MVTTDVITTSLQAIDNIVLVANDEFALVDVQPGSTIRLDGNTLFGSTPVTGVPVVLKHSVDNVNWEDVDSQVSDTGGSGYFVWYWTATPGQHYFKVVGDSVESNVVPITVLEEEAPPPIELWKIGAVVLAAVGVAGGVYVVTRR